LKNPENEYQKVANQITNITSIKSLMKFVGYLTVPWFMKAFKITFFGKKFEDFFHEAVCDLMRIREEKGIVRNDMIQLLMQAKKGKLSHESKETEKIAEGFATVEESQMGKSKVTRVWDDEDIAAQ
jgi:cytochrome P450 family 9